MNATALADLSAACGADRPAALCRELTKLHEDVWRDTLGALAGRAAETPPRGEVTIVLAGRQRESDEPSIGLEQGRSEVANLVKAGWSRPSAAREVAQRTGLPRRELFRDG